MSKFDLFPSQQGKSFLIYGFSAGRSPCWRKILISRVCLSPGPLHHQSQLVRSLGEIQYLGTKIILDSAEYSTFTLLYYNPTHTQSNYPPTTNTSDTLNADYRLHQLNQKV